MIRTISIFILITTGLLAKKYLLEVADEGGDEGKTKKERGSDFSFQQNFEMVQDGQFY